MSLDRLLALDERTEVPLLVAFSDITRYAANTRHQPDPLVADTLDTHYATVARHVATAGGRVVKFIGDSALMIFPEEAVDDGVLALLELKHETDAWLRDLGWSGARLVVKAHFAGVVAGPVGPPGLRCFDVLGKGVNTTALLKTDSFALSAQAFRKLAPATRGHFKKHTPPITYIRTQDRH